MKEFCQIYAKELLAEGLSPALIYDEFDEEVHDEIDEWLGEVFDLGTLGDSDGMRPKLKSGYKPKLVVRDGKKKWINERLAGKKIVLSSKQRMALAKARRKAHTSVAKIHRAKSMRLVNK